MKKVLLSLILILSIGFTKAQEWKVQSLKQTYTPTFADARQTDVVYYKTSWADCMAKAHITCAESWWCPAIEPALVAGWAIQCTINTDQVWNKTELQKPTITLEK